MYEDKEWKEHEVHLESETKSKEQEEEEEEEEYVNHLFDQDDDEDEVLDFDLEQPVEIILRGHKEITNTTGLSLWRGAEVVSDFLLKNPSIIENKSVLELGAGPGLLGIVVSKYLSPSKAVLTDGDVGVLRNLRSNLERNSISTEVTCPQLIWGQGIEEFRERFGRFQVIMATECVYMTTSVEPFWKTIYELLEETPEAVAIFNHVAFSQSPLKDIFEVAEKFGFVRTEPSKDVYLFRRKASFEGGSKDS